MKFLSTGNIRNSEGPKKIILFTISFFIFFVLINFLLECIHIPFSKEDFFNTIETSFVIRLEKVHLQLFMFSFILIFDFSILIYSRIKSDLKSILFFLAILLFVLYLFSLLYYTNSEWFYYFYWMNIFIFHFFILFFQSFLLFDLIKE